MMDQTLSFNPVLEDVVEDLTLEDVAAPPPLLAKNKKSSFFKRSSRLSAHAAQRHSRRVRNLRLLVPAAAAGLVMTYVLSASPRYIDPKFAENFTVTETDGKSLKLDRPRYAGESLDGLAFEISALTAVQNPNAPDLITLDNPEALRGLTAGKSADEVTVQAKSGLLDTENKRIDLEDDVRLVHSFGGSTMVLNTDAAQVDLATNIVTSTAGVTGSGDQGTLSADEAVVFQNEGRTVLTGNVQFRIEPKKSEDDDAEGLR